MVASDGGPPVEAPPAPGDAHPDADDLDDLDRFDDLGDFGHLDDTDAVAGTEASPLLSTWAAEADDAPAIRTAWDGPIVTAARPRVELPAAPSPPTEEPSSADAVESSESQPLTERSAIVLVGVGVVAALVAGAQVAETAGWIDHVADPVVRAGALLSTWCAIVLLSRRCGGRTLVVGGFTAVVLTLAGVFPETWSLAGAAVAGGVVYGLLAMVYTRPARGVGLARELAISASIGVVGALVVAGFHVELRPYRFRMIVLAIVLIGAFLLAWRLGHGARSIGRRGAVIIVVGVVALAGSLAYVQAVRTWGSPSLVHNLDDLKASVSDLLGAAPRPVEAFVGFPALVWGVSSRRRRRQGWWMCAFGALGAAGVTSSLIYPDVTVGSAMASTAYDVVIGLLIGLLVVWVDGLLTGGGGRRADATGDLDADRPEPARFTPLL